MSYSHRLSRFAAVGLIAAICVLTSAELAGDSAKSSPPEPVAPSSERPKSDQRAFKSALPIKIIADPAEAESAKVREEESAKRENSDLEAQWKAAYAAEKAADLAEWGVGPTWIGLALNFFNVLGLLWVIHETRRTAEASVTSAEASVTSAEAAIKSVKLAHKVMIETLRARVFISAEILFIIVKEKSIEAHIVVSCRNTGQTPATDLRISAQIFGNLFSANSRLEKTKALHERMPNDTLFGRALFPGEEIKQKVISSINFDQLRVYQRENIDFYSKFSNYISGAENILTVKDLIFVISVIYGVIENGNPRGTYSIFSFSPNYIFEDDLLRNRNIGTKTVYGKFIRGDSFDTVT